MRAISTLAAAAALCTLSLYSFAADPLPDDDWLHVQGNQIVDNHGNPVWLTGANWFGFNTSERVFHGLWAVNLEDRIADLASRGINILRVPISTELIREWQSGMAAVPSINDYVNPELAGKTSLEIFDAVITESKKYGVKILIDVHSAEADNSGHFEPMWYEGNIDSETFYQTWEWLAERYKNDDTVIAFDIENEPHGKPWADSPFAKWDDSTDESNWKYACETAGKRVLAINPNLLVLCEGIESYPKDGVTWASNSSKDFHNYWWGGNLRGAAEFPVDLGEHQDQLVYSPHIYGPSVYLQPWFEPDFTPESLMQNAWRDNWFFLYEQGTSPLLLGEWGGHLDDGQNEKWMGYARDLIVEHKLHHTFWCLNPNSGDTGGLWGYDWTTWDEEKYALLKPALWQDSNGKFVSLDHQVALGSSTVGITVSDYYASQTPALNISAPVSNSAFLPGADMLIQFDQRLSSGANIYIDGGQRGTTSQNHATISAPLETGYYQLQLVALNSQGVEISVSDSVNFQVVDEVIAEPAINITSPVAGFGIEVGSQFTLTYTLENAAGARVTLDSNSQFINGNSVDLIAPLIEGNYTVDVVAADENNQLLEASDMIAISVFTPAAAELSCEVGSSDTWSDGFVINTITITNNGENTLNGWQVLLSFSDEASFSSGWGGVFTPSADGHSVSASNLDWNGTLQPGSSTSIGLQGTHSGQFAAPDCVGN